VRKKVEKHERRRLSAVGMKVEKNELIH